MRREGLDVTATGGTGRLRWVENKNQSLTVK